jgi:hypothetical protein
LRRTVAEDNEASNQQALRHAKEIAQLNNTIAELRMNLKNGSKAREVLTSDTVTLLPSLGKIPLKSMTCEILERHEQLTQCLLL